MTDGDGQDKAASDGACGELQDLESFSLRFTHWVEVVAYRSIGQRLIAMTRSITIDPCLDPLLAAEREALRCDDTDGYAVLDRLIQTRLKYRPERG